MNSRNVLQTVIGPTAVTLLIVGCGPRGFKDPSLCPNSDAAVAVPERLPTLQWSAMDSPSDDTLWEIEVLSLTNAWAVGHQGSILHYDGTTWTAMSSPPIDYYKGSGLRGVSMLSADEGWAVGRSGPSESVVLHYANQRWSIVDEPRTLPLQDVDFVSLDKGWAVGHEILHYDGNNWNVLDVTIPGYLNGIDMVSADEGWAVGDQGQILHHQGNTWQHVDSPVEIDLWDVDMRSTEDGWIVGYDGTILHFEWNNLVCHCLPHFSFVVCRGCR